MTGTVVLSLLSGVIGANGIPHFLSGIIRRDYPIATGGGHTANAVAGFAAFVVAAALLLLADAPKAPLAAALSGAVGFLAMSLFHARRGAFALSRRQGRPEWQEPTEYLSPAWVQAVRELFILELAGVDLSGVELAWSEEVTGAPARLLRRGRHSVGWHFLLKDGRVTVGAGTLPDASVVLSADYHALRFLQRYEVAGLPERREQLARYRASFSERTLLSAVGVSEALPRLPEALRERLTALHDRIASITA